MQCQASNILIYSPDTDVYNIGLGLLNQHSTATYAIQLNVPHSDEKVHLHQQLKSSITEGPGS